MTASRIILIPKVASAGGGATGLDDLTDVTITAAASGDILRHNGTAWVDAVGTTHFEAAGAVAAHEADTTNVHGIADTSALETTTGSASKVSTHAALTSSVHGISAFGATLVDDADAAAARTTLGVVIGTDVAAQSHVAATSGAHGISAFGATLVDDADAATARSTLGLVIGTNVQAYDAELSAIAGLTSAADKMPYFTGSGAAALADLTAAGRALIDDASASAQRTTLGLAIDTDVASQTAIKAAQPALLGSTLYGIPGWIFTAGWNLTLTGAVNRIHYEALVVTSAITISHAFMHVVTSVAASNTRIGVYAATSAWQPTGAAVADWGAIDCSSTGDKTVTGLSTVLTPGRYLLAFLTSAAIEFRSWFGHTPFAATVTGATGFEPWPSFASQTYGTLPASPPSGSPYGSTGSNPAPLVIRWTVN
jgi:hypothetical protein